MKPGFQNQRGLRTRSFDGRHFIVEDWLEFHDELGNQYHTEIYLHTDGGSIPPLSFIGGLIIFFTLPLMLISPWFGIAGIIGIGVCYAGRYLTPYARWWWAFILHDACYQNWLWRFDGKRYVVCTLTEEQSNALLYEAMRCQHAQWWEYTAVWIALNWFGWRAFDEDRKRKCKFSE